MAGIKIADRDEFVFIMAHEGMPLSHIQQILRDAATVQASCVAECNTGLNYAGERRKANAQRRITQVAASFDCVAIFSGDPRGATTKLKVPSGRTNDFVSSGICVPTPRY